MNRAKGWRPPVCPCGQARLEGDRVCRECWGAAPRELKAQCHCPDPSVRSAAFNDLVEFAQSRSKEGRQPALL